MVLEPNRPVFAVQTQTAGGLPGPVTNTNHNPYRTRSDANTKAADAELSGRCVHRRFNMFRHTPCIVSDLPMRNLRHSIQIGMLDHLQNWIFPFMKTHEWLDKSKAICLSVPAYHDLTPQNQSYEEVSRCNGKEMKAISRHLLGVVTQSLPGRSPAQRPIFNRAIECPQALLEFYLCSRYKSHIDATLSYVGDTLHRFHTFKDVF
jgi:hypothetical protein